MTSSTVLILGARGRFGGAAVQAFSQAGWQVVAQARPGATGLPALAGVHWAPIAPQDTQALRGAATGASAVVHALSPAYTHAAWRREVPVLAQSAIDVARGLGATLMLPGNVYNFGASLPSRLAEDAPQAADTFKGRMRIRIESMIERATQDGAMRAVVIRGGDFFGSGRGSWLDEVMVSGLRGGRFTYPGPMEVPHAWAYLPDMARAFVQVAAARERLGRFELMHFGGYSLTGADWAEALQDVAWEQGWLAGGAGLRTRRLPWPLMQALGLVSPQARALCEMRYLWHTPHALVNRRMAAVCGPEPRTPFAQALRAALADLGMPAPPAAQPAAAWH